MKFLVYLFFASLLVGQLPSLFGFHVYAHDVMFGILFVSSVINKKKRIRPKLLFPILLFLGAGLLSGSNFLYLGRWAFYACVYVLVVQKIVPGKTWLKGLFWTGTAFAAGGIVQFFLYPDLRNLYYLGWDPYYYRVFSSLFDPNFTGIILVLSLLAGLFLFSRKKTIWLISQIGIIGLALILTFSRSSYLAGVVGLATYGIMKQHWKPLIIFLVVLLISILIPKPSLEAFRLTREVSTFARIGNWQQSVEEFLKSPIIGYGFPAKLTGGAGIDNSFLFVLGSSGIVGFSAFAWFWAKIIRGIRGIRRIEGKKELKVVVLASIAAVFVHSLFVNSLFYPWVMIWLWVLVGAIEVQTRDDR